MNEQQACTLCGAGGHTAAQCNWRTDAALDKIRAAGLTIDGDNAYKRDLLDCVVGALAFGFQGRQAPEESHWLHRFWEIGNAEREARAALAQPSPAPELEQLRYKAELYDEVWALVTGKGYMNVTTAISKLEQEREDAQARVAELEKQPKLTVWFGPMPESNGKSNFTAVLMRNGASLLEGITGGITIARSEYPDRARYEADRMRYLIGEREQEPDILDYDAEKHSGYKAQVAQAGQAKKWTYASEQETNCAGCGVRKHTPLRVDWMGGYVCLTCIDEKLEALYEALPDAQAGQVPELDQLHSMLGADDQVDAAKKIAELVGCRLSRSALTEAQLRRLYENSTEAENEQLGFAAFARLMRRAEAVHQIAAAPAQGGE